jgi:lysophospholipase L1-like esterase
MQPLIQNGSVVLFQDDSITDAGRSLEDDQELGSGYPALVAVWYAASNPDKKVRFPNRGISGSRAADPLARWRQWSRGL